jgi:hypothetical protein
MQCILFDECTLDVPIPSDRERDIHKKICSSWEKSVDINQESSLSNSAAADYLRRSLIIYKMAWFVRMSA